MLELEPVLVQRLAALPAFTGWRISGGTDAANRTLVPGADVRMSGANGAAERRTVSQLQFVWTVGLVVPRGDSAAGQLGAAMRAALGALHNWRPGSVAGQEWTELQFANVREASFSDSGLAGFEISFTTTTLVPGQT
ncbi:hypothetical protein [Delftia lacustris]|uniref:hypothetical protein n=1 Tax=Delftia lacustris TaxID=558537 RepID=UPI0035A5B17C